MKSDSNKLNECLININQENVNLKNEILQIRYSAQNNYLSNQRLTFQKNSLISSQENIKENSFNITNDKICGSNVDRIISSNNFKGLENKNFIDHLEFKNYLTLNNLKTENNLKNKSADSASCMKEKEHNLFIKNNNNFCNSLFNDDVIHSSIKPFYSTSKTSSLLKRSFSIENYLVKLDKECEKGNYFKIGISQFYKNNPEKNIKEIILKDNKISQESFKMKENSILEKSQTLNKKSFQSINESKSMSPNKSALHLQKFIKPPSIRV